MRIVGLSWRWRQVAILGARFEAMSEEARRRLEALRFWQEFGLAAAAAHAGRCERTLYAWRARFRQAGPGGLEPRSRRPHRVPKRNWPGPITAEIRRLREAHPNLGKAKIHPLLRRFCEPRGLKCPSVATIGRLIADAGGLRTAPVRLDSRGRRKRPRKPRKPKGMKPLRPGELLAVDTMILLDTGIRRSAFSAVDIATRTGFAVAAPFASSRWSADFLRIALDVLPFRVEAVLSDNGSEFEGRFRQLVRSRRIGRLYTYPRCPRINAHVERFHRSLKDEFIPFHHDLLFADADGLTHFNHQLARWLIWYNRDRPHASLHGRAPLSFLPDPPRRPAVIPRAPPTSILAAAPDCYIPWTHTQPRPDWLRLRLPDPLPIPSAPRWSLPGKTRGPPLGPPQTLRSRSSPLAPSPVFPTTAFSPRASTKPTLAPPSQTRSEPTLNIPDCQMSWARTRG